MFLFVCFAWIFFRADNIHQAIQIIANCFSGTNTAEMGALFINAAAWNETWQSLILFVILEILLRNIKAISFFNNRHAGIRWACYYGLVFWILIFGALNQPPSFIYFQF